MSKKPPNSDCNASYIKALGGEQIIRSIRKRPGMYVGGIDSFGVRQLVFEMLANAIDQFLLKKATYVSFSIDGEVMQVADDGGGLPPFKGDPDAIEQWFLTAHSMPSADGHAPHVHLTPLGCGLCVTAALAERLEVNSINNEKAIYLLFSKGKLLEKSITETDAPSGCRLRMTVDRSIMETSLPALPELRGYLLQAAHLFPGFIVKFMDERFLSSYGLGDYIHIAHHVTTHEAWKRPGTFIFNGMFKDVEITAAAIGNAEEKSTCFQSWANGSSTPTHGTHVNGFREALSNMGWVPTVGMIHVVMHDPQYAGPVCDELITPPIQGIVEEALLPALETFLMANPAR